jgi:phosphate transport system permease protein
MALSLYDRYTQGRLIAFGSFIILSITFLSVTLNKLSVRFDARRKVESIFKFIFFLFSTMAVLTTIGIILSLIFETIRFFSQVGFF